MKIINLRDYYPFYTQDTLLEVSDEVAGALADAERLERNYIRRVYYHKAHYSLDVGDGIETSAIRCHDFTPEEVLELTEQYRLLCWALNSLLENQGRRVEAMLSVGEKAAGDCRSRGCVMQFSQRQHKERTDRYAEIHEREISSRRQIPPKAYDLSLSL